MNLLPQVRKQITDKLWERFKGHLDQAAALQEDLVEQKERLLLDHFAIIDLPSANSGIGHLESVFKILGYVRRGEGYLADKANDFIWMAEEDAEEKFLESALPQVVLADFRLNELSPEARYIVERLASKISAPPVAEMESLAELAKQGESRAAERLVKLVFQYLVKREHALPSKEEFETVRKENELLAWVLVFGREVNHFGIAAYHWTTLKNLKEVNHYMEDILGFDIAVPNGKRIQGKAEEGIEQSATTSEPLEMQLANGKVAIRDRFLEFVWRHGAESAQPLSFWNAWYRGFVPQNANHVIESLYEKKLA